MTEDLNKQIDQIREVAKGTKELRESAENNWINKILQSIGGWSLTGWLASLIQSVIMIIVVIIIVGFGVRKISRCHGKLEG